MLTIWSMTDGRPNSASITRTCGLAFGRQVAGYHHGAMLAIKKKGLQMPTDIGLVGFNNEPVTSLVTPAISSVEMPSFEMGKAAAKLFIETMHNKESATTIEKILHPKLIVRESSLKFSA